MARRKTPKHCEQCGLAFFPVYQSAGRFCSHRCSVAWRKSDRHHAWKGKDLGYAAAHSWLREHHSDRKTACEECGTRDDLQFAKKKGRSYTRNIEDYRILCRGCHLKYDGQFAGAPWNKGNVTTYPKVCEQCGQAFEAVKKSRRFCSNLCSGRFRYGSGSNFNRK